MDTVNSLFSGAALLAQSHIQGHLVHSVRLQLLDLIKGCLLTYKYWNPQLDQPALPLMQIISLYAHFNTNLPLLSTIISFTTRPLEVAKYQN